MCGGWRIVGNVPSLSAPLPRLGSWTVRCGIPHVAHKAIPTYVAIRALNACFETRVSGVGPLRDTLEKRLDVVAL